MTRLELYLTHPLAETVGWALLHSLWQGALVALLFAGGLALARRRSPQLRYLLGCGALVLLVASPVGTGAFLYGRAEPPVQARVGLDADHLTVTAQDDSRDDSMSPATPAQPAAPTSLATSSVTALGARALELLRTATPWLTGFWLLGVVLFLLRFSGQALYVHRFRARHRTPADAHWQARARALATRLGVRRSWRLVLGYAESPLTVGVLRPLIVLPTSALTGMPAAQLEALLAHELAHIRRHDYLVNLFQCVTEALMFYHPAVWWVSSTVRRAREECCDGLAVEVCGDAKLYARALTNLEALRQPPALALAATDKPLLARVRRLLGLGEIRAFPPTATAVLLVLMLALGTGLGVAGQTTAAAPTASSTAPEAPKQASPRGVITGRVQWYSTPLANVKVALRTPLEMVDEENCCKPQRTLRTTTTDETGAYRFEGVPFGTYALEAVPAAKVYQPEKEQTSLAMSSAELYVTLRVDKRLAVMGPPSTTGVSLTPTLRWQPVPEAVRYEVSLFNVVTGEFVPLDGERTTPSLTVEKPLDQNTLYSWSVTAYADHDIPIASNHEPTFSTSPETTPLPVELPSLGIHTVLRDDWQRRAPNVFEHTDRVEGKMRLVFSKVAGTDPRAVLRRRMIDYSVIGQQPFAGRVWWFLSSKTGTFFLATRQGKNVYLIAVENSEDENYNYRVEFSGLVMPDMLRNFQIDE